MKLITTAEPTLMMELQAQAVRASPGHQDASVVDADEVDVSRLHGISLHSLTVCCLFDGIYIRVLV